MGAGAQPSAPPRTRLWAALATLVAAIGLGACGSDLGSDEGEDTEVQVAEAGPPEGEFTMSTGPLYIDKGKGGVDGPGGTIAEFEEETGIEVELPRGHQRQRVVLRQAAARARERRVGRARHHHRHRLDGEALPRPRLRAGLRQVGDPERRGEPAAEPSEPRVRSRAVVHGPVAERAHGPRRAQGPRARTSTRSTTSSIPSTKAR